LKMVFVLMVVLTITLGTGAMAAICFGPLGYVAGDQGWSQRFAEDGGISGEYNVPFDMIQVTPIDGSEGSFDLPAFRNFNLDGWTSSEVGSAYVAKGKATGILEWEFFFKNPSESPLAFHYEASIGGLSTVSQDFYWDGKDFTFPVNECGVVTAVPVPEPGTILAACSILGPVGFIFRRRRS
jgi:hypothetical protein